MKTRALGEVVYLRLSTAVRERVKTEAERLGLRPCDVLRYAVARGLADGSAPIGSYAELASGRQEVSHEGRETL